MRWVLIVLLACMVLPAPAISATAPASTGKAAYPGASQEFSPAEQRRYYALLSELRCPQCQDETLKSSQAPLAIDLRKEIRHQMLSGWSNERIKQYLVARYGEFILYKPRFEPKTYALWLGPGILLLIALFVAIRHLRRRGKPPAKADEQAIARILRGPGGGH